jgi:hypothetical protein
MSRTSIIKIIVAAAVLLPVAHFTLYKPSTPARTSQTHGDTASQSSEPSPSIATVTSPVREELGRPENASEYFISGEVRCALTNVPISARIAVGGRTTQSGQLDGRFTLPVIASRSGVYLDISSVGYRPTQVEVAPRESVSHYDVGVLTLAASALLRIRTVDARGRGTVAEVLCMPTIVSNEASVSTLGLTDEHGQLTAVTGIGLMLVAKNATSESAWIRCPATGADRECVLRLDERTASLIGFRERHGGIPVAGLAVKIRSTSGLVPGVILTATNEQGKLDLPLGSGAWDLLWEDRRYSISASQQDASVRAPLPGSGSREVVVEPALGRGTSWVDLDRCEDALIRAVDISTSTPLEALSGWQRSFESTSTVSGWLDLGYPIDLPKYDDDFSAEAIGALAVEGPERALALYSRGYKLQTLFDTSTLRANQQVLWVKFTPAKRPRLRLISGNSPYLGAVSVIEYESDFFRGIDVYRGAVGDGGLISFPWSGGNVTVRSANGEFLSAVAPDRLRSGGDVAVVIEAPGEIRVSLPSESRLACVACRSLRPLDRKAKAHTSNRFSEGSESGVSFPNLPPGRYLLGPPDLLDALSTAHTDSRVQTVDVRAGERTTIEFPAAWDYSEVVEGSVALCGVDVGSVFAVPLFGRQQAGLYLAGRRTGVGLEASAAGYTYRFASLSAKPDKIALYLRDLLGFDYPMLVIDPGEPAVIDCRPITIRADAGFRGTIFIEATNPAEGTMSRRMEGATLDIACLPVNITQFTLDRDGQQTTVPLPRKKCGEHAFVDLPP